MLVNLLALALDRLLPPVAMLMTQARDRRTANRGCGPSAPSRRTRPAQPRNSTRRCIRFRSITRTPVHFGEGTTAKALDAEIARMGDVVMLAFGGGSIRRSGPYDQVRGQLEAAGKTVVDFGGIIPNPTYAKAQEGASWRASTASPTSWPWTAARSSTAARLLPCRRCSTRTSGSWNTPRARSPRRA